MAEAAAPPAAPTRNPLELITPVAPMQQGNTSFLTFVMPSRVFGALACPRRFSEDPTRGVQRDLNEKQVLSFMESMREGKPIPANVTLNLTGWIVVDGQLMAQEGTSFIEALDGQHRGEAVKRLLAAGEDAVVERYGFSVMAVMEATDEERRALFMAQVDALGVSREHAAAIRFQAKAFGSAHKAEAAMIADLLDVREDSPLRGRVHRGDLLRGSRNRAHLPDGKWVTFSTLCRTMLESLSGRHSVTRRMREEERVQFAVDLLSAARECYPTQFEDGGTLRTTFGLRTLYLLAARHDGRFRNRLEEAGCTRAEMVRLFRLVPRFHWAVRDGGERVPALVVQRFNERLATALAT